MLGRRVKRCVEPGAAVEDGEETETGVLSVVVMWAHTFQARGNPTQRTNISADGAEIHGCWTFTSQMLELHVTQVLLLELFGFMSPFLALFYFR